jgi:2-iminobutanoate/2-iminopropanoate deaminase
MKQIIRAPRAGNPVGPYSQAVVVGDLIFVSAEKGVDPVSGKPAEGGVAGETTQALLNIRAILEEAGASPADVVRCVVYMLDTEDFAVMNRAYGAFFTSSHPARSTVMVSRLPLGLKVLIEVTAVRGAGKEWAPKANV